MNTVLWFFTRWKLCTWLCRTIHLLISSSVMFTIANRSA